MTHPASSSRARARCSFSGSAETSAPMSTGAYRAIIASSFAASATEPSCDLDGGAAVRGGWPEQAAARHVRVSTRQRFMGDLR